MTIDLGSQHPLERLFPLPGALWDQSDDLKDFLRLADGHLPAKQRARCGNLPMPQRIGRMLFHLRAACTEEARGHWNTADVYWTAMMRDYEVCRKQPEAWPAVTGHPGVEIAQRFRDEVLVDTAYALANGLLDFQKPPVDRLMLHVKRAMTLMDEPATRQHLAERAGGALLEIADRQETWFVVLPYLQELLDAYGATKHLSLLVAKAQFRTCIAAARSRGDDHAGAAALLEEQIIRFNRLRRDDPTALDIHEMLSVLYYMHAARLANDLRLHDALEDAYRARLLGGDDVQSRQLLSELTEAMQNLIRRCEELKQQLKAEPGRMLNDQGIKMMTAAQVGFSVLNTFKGSVEAGELTEQRALAARRRLWAIAGLPEPTEGFDNATAELEAVLASVPREKDGDWASALRTAAAERSRLAGIDWPAVVRSLDGERPSKPEPPPGPRLPVKARPASGDREPLAYAYFVPEARGLRLLSAAAAVAVVVALGLWSWDAWTRFNRDQAYAAMKVAEANLDEPAIMASAAAFLGAAPLAGKDPRDAEVRRTYSKTLVHWFLGLRDQPRAAAEQTLHDYRKLAVNSDSPED